MSDGGAETYERLLTTARQMYLREGMARFSLRQAARNALISPAAVYRHFADKEALVRAIAHQGFVKFRAYLMGSLAAKTPRGRLEGSADAYLRFALENPQDYRMMFMDVVFKAGDSSDTFQLLVDRVRECMGAHVIREGDVVETTTLIWSHLHGLASLRLSGHLDSIGNDAAFARFYGRSMAALFEGLRPK